MPIFNEFRVNYPLLDRVVENRKVIPVPTVKLAKHIFTCSPEDFQNNSLGFTEWKKYIYTQLEQVRDKNREN